MSLPRSVWNYAFLCEVREMPLSSRRLLFIAEMSGEELDEYADQVKWRGMEPYEVVAIAERRRELQMRME